MTAATLPTTEAAFQSRVIELAKLHGWRCIHHRPARTDKGWRTAMEGAPGWPDIFCVRGRRAIAVELKVGRNKTTLDQDAWLSALREAGIETYVWRPEAWDEVMRVLGREK